MKIKFTYTFTDRDRQAVALHLGTKKPATRTQMLMWVATLIAEQKAQVERQFRIHELNSDPKQQTIPGVLSE